MFETMLSAVRFSWDAPYRIALGVIDALERRGIAVPGDISVVGYDNSQVARLAHISLTSVSQDVHALARSAVATAVARINGKEPEIRLHAAHLIIRTTTAARYPELRGRPGVRGSGTISRKTGAKPSPVAER
jgi:ABC-type xylose transport system substrate-binding protein